MPFTFPSHAGLVLPLWVRRPDVFDGVAMGLGSILPGPLDGAVRLVTGDSSHAFAHSLLGLVTVVIPLGVLLIWALDLGMSRELRRLRALAPSAPGADPPPAVVRRAVWVRRLGSRAFRGERVLLSVTVGAASHLLFDAVSHRHLDLLLPWTRPEILPPALAGPWIELQLRGMRDALEIGFFGTVWLALSALGAVLFLWVLAVAARRRTWR